MLRRWIAGWFAVSSLVVAGGAGAQPPDLEPIPILKPEPQPIPPPVEVVPYEFDLVIRDGAIEGGPPLLSVDHNSSVTLALDADVTDVVWIEGYDIHFGVAPGVPSVVTFTAERPGHFSIWIGRSDHVIATLEVGPPVPQ